MNLLSKLHTPYNKFVIAAIGVVLTGLNVLYGDNSTVQLVINVATALGVFQVPNKKVQG